MRNKDKLIITISDKELGKYGLNFSASGEVIDELAYCAGEWTSDDLFDNNLDYEPMELPTFNFEDDLLANTKSWLNLIDLTERLAFHLPGNFHNEGKLQAGASLALNYPDCWKELLDCYTTEVRNQDNYSKHLYSQAYADELQEARDDFWEDMRREWLDGDYRGYEGVIKKISKYFTDDRDSGDYDEKNNIYTFTLSLSEAKEGWQDWTCERFGVKKYRDYFIGQIVSAGQCRKDRDEIAREKRRAEQEATEKYQSARKAEAEAERVAKLKSMTLT